MLRRSLISAAAVIVLATTTVAIGGIAGAKVYIAPVDATNYTASCSGFASQMIFKPPLAGEVGTVSAKVKGTLTDCTTQPNGSGTPIDIRLGKVTGMLSLDPGVGFGPGCGLFVTGATFPVTGSLSITWKTAPKTPKLTSGDSVLSPQSMTTESGGNLVLDVPSSPGLISSTGSFQGTDGGMSDSFSALGPTSSEVVRQCFLPPYMRSLLFIGNGGPFSLG